MTGSDGMSMMSSSRAGPSITTAKGGDRGSEREPRRDRRGFDKKIRNGIGSLSCDILTPDQPCKVSGDMNKQWENS